jgi:hypothetical protein
MLKLNKNREYRLMTLLVQVAGGISGAMAVVALAVALLTKVASPVLPSPDQPDAQEVQVQIATPYVPGSGTLDGQVQEVPLRLEIPPPLAPDAY